MKIATEVVWQMTDSGMEEVSRAECDYGGQLALCGGGPSSEQKQAASANANLTNQLGQTAGKQEAFAEKQQGLVNPFYQSRMDSGDPNFSLLTDQAGGINARAFQPARAALAKRLSSFGTSLPSGFADASYRDLDTQQAHAYDDSLSRILAQHEAAKQAGAAGLVGQQVAANPLGYYQGAIQGNQGILQAPLQRPGLAGMLGGFAGGASSAFFG